MTSWRIKISSGVSSDNPKRDEVNPHLTHLCPEMQAVAKMAILAKFRQLTWRFLCKLHQQRWAWHIGEFDDFGDFYANYVVDHKSWV